MKKALFIEATRDGYTTGQVQNTMTVEELIGYLEQFDLETPVYLRHDGGYTYGGIKYSSFSDQEGDDDEETDED